MKGFWSYITVLLLAALLVIPSSTYLYGAGKSLGEENVLYSEYATLGTLSRASGTLAFSSAEGQTKFYLGPYPIVDCYRVADLVYGADKDSLIANLGLSFFCDYKIGDTLKWKARALATVYRQNPLTNKIAWPDSVGTNTKSVVLIDDTVSANTKGWMISLQGVIKDSVANPYLWVEFTFDSVTVDRSVANVQIGVEASCIKPKEDTP